MQPGFGIRVKQRVDWSEEHESCLWVVSILFLEALTSQNNKDGKRNKVWKCSGERRKEEIQMVRLLEGKGILSRTKIFPEPRK